MQESRKISMFINEPLFQKSYKNKVPTGQFFSPNRIKSLFPHQTHIERFKNLQKGRNQALKQKQIDQNFSQVLQALHDQMHKISMQNNKLDVKKEEITSQFKMNYIRQEMQRDFQKLSFFIEKYSKLKNQLNSNREQIQKMTKMTEIRKALTMQNRILNQENQQLRQQQLQLDQALSQK